MLVQRSIFITFTIVLSIVIQKYKTIDSNILLGRQKLVVHIFLYTNIVPKSIEWKVSYFEIVL